MKYIIQILIASLLICTLISCDRSKKVKDNLTFSKSNVVYNSTNKKNLDRMVSAGLDELAIEHVVVLLTEIKEPFFNNDYFVKAYIEEISNNFYIIHIIDLSDRETLEVISHELVHLEQYKKDDLTVKNTYIIWKGITYTPSEYEAVSHEERPWEYEAYQRQKGLSRKIKKRVQSTN